MTKKGIQAIFNNGIEFLIGSLLLIVVTNSYSLEETGVWIVFLTLVYVGTKFREGITQTSLMKFSVGVSNDQKFAVYWISIFLTFGIELLLGALAYITAMYFLEGMLAGLMANYIWLGLPQALHRLFQFFSQSRLDAKNMVVSNVILLNVIVLVIAYVLSEGIAFIELPKVISIGYWVAIFWQLFIQNVYAWTVNLKTISLPKGYIEYATNGVLRELFGTISSRAYILLTAGLIGYAESALLGIASRYANLIFLPNSAYQGLLYPKACEMVSNGSVSIMLNYYRRAISWMQAGFIPYVFILLTFGSAGIILLHGKEFMASIPFFAALILAGAFITPYGNAFGSVCQAAGRPDLVTKLVLMNSILNLFLSYTFIVYFGIWGAVVAPILTDFVGLVVIQIVLRKVYSGNIIESYSNIFSRLKILIHLIQKLGKSKFGGLFS